MAVRTQERPVPLTLALAPVHKRAFGIAVGSVCGSVLFVLTAFHSVFQPPNGLPLSLLAQYFYGYEVSWRGAAIGFGWAFVTGFVAGWFAAFVRNLHTVLKVFVLKTKGELVHTMNLLDHI